jgi:hypothetical protein
VHSSKAQRSGRDYVTGNKTDNVRSTVRDSSVVAVQIFDQRKFKRKDQGFLGVINVKVSDVLDLELGGQGQLTDRSAFTG